jgi:hypothetical protein
MPQRTSSGWSVSRIAFGSRVRDSTQSSWTRVPQLLLFPGEAKARVGLSHDSVLPCRLVQSLMRSSPGDVLRGRGSPQPALHDALVG